MFRQRKNVRKTFFDDCVYLILKLLITSEMASRYTCYFCNGRNLENVDFLQKELHNIDFWQNVQEKI